jgi:hypothetical protein
METEEDKSKLRLVVNPEKEEDKLQFYHDIFYNENTHHNDEEICSKLIFDINNERMMRLLGLDTQYNDNNNNNFSKSLWKEKRYIIADHLLCEFVIICNQILEAVRWRMENAYPHKIWPKSKFPEIHKRFRKWHDLVYGKHRRTAETFISLDKAKVKLNKLKKKEQSDIYNNEAKKIIDSLDNFIIENYNKLESQRFIQIQQKYRMVTLPLLEISYPQFLRELHDKQHIHKII